MWGGKQAPRVQVHDGQSGFARDGFGKVASPSARSADQQHAAQQAFGTATGVAEFAQHCNQFPGYRDSLRATLVGCEREPSATARQGVAPWRH